MPTLQDKIAHNNTEISKGKDMCWLHIPKSVRFLSRKKRWCRIQDREADLIRVKVNEGQEKAGMVWLWYPDDSSASWRIDELRSEDNGP
jgi:hypothetical protein